MLFTKLQSVSQVELNILYESSSSLTLLLLLFLFLSLGFLCLGTSYLTPSSPLPSHSSCSCMKPQPGSWQEPVPPEHISSWIARCDAGRHPEPRQVCVCAAAVCPTTEFSDGNCYCYFLFVKEYKTKGCYVGYRITKRFLNHKFVCSICVIIRG